MFPASPYEYRPPPRSARQSYPASKARSVGPSPSILWLNMPDSTMFVLCALAISEMAGSWERGDRPAPVRSRFVNSIIHRSMSSASNRAPPAYGRGGSTPDGTDTGTSGGNVGSITRTGAGNVGSVGSVTGVGTGGAIVSTITGVGGGVLVRGTGVDNLMTSTVSAVTAGGRGSVGIGWRMAGNGVLRMGGVGDAVGGGGSVAATKCGGGAGSEVANAGAGSATGVA